MRLFLSIHVIFCVGNGLSLQFSFWKSRVLLQIPGRNGTGHGIVPTLVMSDRQTDRHVVAYKVAWSWLMVEAWSTTHLNNRGPRMAWRKSLVFSTGWNCIIARPNKCIDWNYWILRLLRGTNPQRMDASRWVDPCTNRRTQLIKVSQDCDWRVWNGDKR